MQSSPSLSLHILSPSPAQNQCGNIDEMIVHLRTCFAYLYTRVTRVCYTQCTGHIFSPVPWHATLKNSRLLSCGTGRSGDHISSVIVFCLCRSQRFAFPYRGNLAFIFLSKFHSLLFLHPSSHPLSTLLLLLGVVRLQSCR